MKVDSDVVLNVLGCRADILGTNCNVMEVGGRGRLYTCCHTLSPPE